MTEADVFAWARKRFNGVCIVHRVAMVRARFLVRLQPDTGGEEYEKFVEVWACPQCRHLSPEQAQRGPTDFGSAKRGE